MNEYIRKIDDVDFGELYSCYTSIEKNIKWINHGKCKQASLQFKDGEDLFFSGLGKGDGSDLEYRNMNPFYVNTIFERLILKFDLRRTRIMLVEPWSCYSMHCDTTPRIHIPIITNKECYFVYKHGLIEHLSVGNVYWVDTTKMHTFINCSPHHRVHLMGSVLA